jgi:hypothetical protein
MSIPCPNPPKLNYSLGIPVIVIVIEALAEELLASVWLVVISSSGMLLSESETLLSDTTDTGNLASIITSTTRTIKRISLFTTATF